MTTLTGEIHGSVEKDQLSEVGLLDFQKDDRRCCHYQQRSVNLLSRDCRYG